MTPDLAIVLGILGGMFVVCLLLMTRDDWHALGRDLRAAPRWYWSQLGRLRFRIRIGGAR